MTATRNTAVMGSGAPNASPPDVDFPFKTALCRFLLAAGGVVNWSWRDEISLYRVRAGRVQCRAGGARPVLAPNQYLFVNAGVLHMFEPEAGSEDAEMEIVLFHPSLIAEPGSGLYRRYVAPLAENRAVPLFILGGEEDWQRRPRALFDEIYHLDREAFGWELTTRDLITRLWLALAEPLAPTGQGAPTPESMLINEQRAKKMLSYIHRNYHEDLTIDGIAAAASISRSECFRCFRRAINKKPIEYLTEYRIERAIGLLRETDLTITDICYRCGFSSPSYFGKVFRNVTGMPPRSFRHETARLVQARPTD